MESTQTLLDDTMADYGEDSPLAGVVTLGEAAQIVGRQTKTVKMWCWTNQVQWRYTLGGHIMIDLLSLLDRKEVLDGKKAN